MIIIQLAGGLGNQMQQYALYEKYRSMGIPVKLDISWFTENERQEGVYARRELELDLFKALTYETCTPEEKRELTGGEDLFSKLSRKLKAKLSPEKLGVFHETQMYHPQLFTFRDKYLIGYFACESYYSDILPQLRRKFVFPEGGSIENKQVMAAMSRETAVSVHIRRGDYLDPENRQMFGGICTEDYYEGAIRLIREQYENPVFYFFSDDTDYVRETYCGDDCRVVDMNHGKDSFYDMMLMSCCTHNICANSTFSFWGARLNAHENKIMIRPSVHKNSQVFEPEIMHELWKGWTLMDAKGNVV